MAEQIVEWGLAVKSMLAYHMLKYPLKYAAAHTLVDISANNYNNTMFEILI